MDYQLIEGIRGGQLLHVLSENMLYVPKIERNGMKEYVCYQTILCSPKKKNSHNVDHTQCTARVRIRRDGTLERMNVHFTVLPGTFPKVPSPKNCHFLWILT